MGKDTISSMLKVRQSAIRRRFAHGITLSAAVLSAAVAALAGTAAPVAGTRRSITVHAGEMVELRVDPTGDEFTILVTAPDGARTALTTENQRPERMILLGDGRWGDHLHA